MNKELLAGAIILGRMDSNRLPGKVLMNIGSIPLMQFIYNRLVKCKSLGQIILATTSRGCDDELAGFFEGIGGKVYRGSDDEIFNVTKRFIAAAEKFELDFALRVNGDSPFPDAQLIDSGYQLIMQSDADLVTNLMPRSYPYGVSVEWIRIAKLKELLNCISSADAEHITAFLYKNQQMLKISSLPILPILSGNIQLTIDYPEDLIRINELIKKTNVPAADLSTSDLILLCEKF